MCIDIHLGLTHSILNEIMLQPLFLAFAGKFACLAGDC